MVARVMLSATSNNGSYNKSRVGKKSLAPLSQGVLNVGLPDFANAGIGRSGVRTDEHLEVHHDAFLNV